MQERHCAAHLSRCAQTRLPAARPPILGAQSNRKRRWEPTFRSLAPCCAAIRPQLRHRHVTPPLGRRGVSAQATDTGPLERCVPAPRSLRSVLDYPHGCCLLLNRAPVCRGSSHANLPLLSIFHSACIRRRVWDSARPAVLSPAPLLALSAPPRPSGHPDLLVSGHCLLVSDHPWECVSASLYYHYSHPSTTSGRPRCSSTHPLSGTNSDFTVASNNLLYLTGIITF